MVQVAEQRNVNSSESAGLPVSLDPRKMREVRVDGCCNDFRVDLPELVDAVGESQNLGGADESEVEWIKEENDVFSEIIVERDCLEFSVHDSCALENWSRPGNDGLGVLKVVLDALSRFVNGKNI